MYVIRLIVLTGLLCLAFSGRLAAQVPSFCGMTHAQIAAALDGTWGLIQFPGAALGGFVPVPLNKQQSDQVKVVTDSTHAMFIQIQNFGLFPLYPATGGAPLPAGIPTYKDVNGNAIDPLAVAGCGWAQMPRWAGQLDVPLGSSTMTMTMVMHFAGPHAGFGVARFTGVHQGSPYTGARAVMLARYN